MTDADRIALDQAEALIAEGRTTEAARLARRLLVARGDNWRAAWTLLAAVDPANPGRAPSARELLQRLEPIAKAGRRPGQKDAVRLGRLLLDHHEVQAARAIADHLVALVPGDMHAAIFKYDLELGLAQYDEALAAIERLIDSRPGQDVSLLRELQVKGLMKAGRAQQAAAVLDLVGEPDDVAALFVRISGHISTGAFAEARDVGLRLIREFGVADRRIARVADQMAAAGGEREAIEMLVEAAARSRGDGALWEALGMLLGRVGETAAAFEANRAACEIKPTVLRLYRRGACEVALDRLPEADATLARLVELAPEATEVHGLRAQIQSARGETEGARESERQVAELLRLNGTARIGVRPPIPRLLGVVACTGMGDFTYQAMALASLKRQFSNAHLTALFSSDDPYKAVVMGFIPDFDVLEDYAGQPFRVDVIGDAPAKNLIFTPADLSASLLARLDRTATMRVPDDREDRLRDELIGVGVDPDRWFMVMHYRQGSTFPMQGSGHRDVSPATFHAMARYVTETLGGQVLRLGHSGMDPIPDLPGYVDLSRTSVELQMYATARARFMLGTDSGPCGYAAGFRTPILKSNSFTDEGAFYATDILMPKNVLNWRGEALDLSKVTADRLLKFKSISAHGEMIGFADNTFEQLRHGVDLLHAETGDVQGWRLEPPARAEPPCPEALTYPPPRRNCRMMPMSELSGRPLWRLD